VTKGEHIAMADTTPTGRETPEGILDDWYAHHYSEIAVTADGSFFERFMHTSMERRQGPGQHFSQVLEIGGNKGEHLPYVRHSYDRYLLTDLRPPTVSEAVLADPKIELGECDVTRLPYADGSFDRVVSTCVLHHVESPFVAAAELRRVLKPGGQVTILVPTDPGLAYRVGKGLTSGRAAKKRGLEQLHDVVGALDHRNHFRSVHTQLKYVFRQDEISVDWYPFRVPSPELNAFIVFHARVSSKG
jgi:phosphatidylethanolamine/phosphatidyl-N-methylethanolamine N-methyltransferase